MDNFFKKRKIITHTNKDGEILECQCPVSKNIYTENDKELRYTFCNPYIKDKTKPVDVLILSEFQYEQDRQHTLIKYFYTAFREHNFCIVPALGCTPGDLTFTKDITTIYTNCKKKNIKKVVADFNPKVIITIGRAIYSVTGNKALTPESFFVPLGGDFPADKDDSWFYTPEFCCKVFPLPTLMSWMHNSYKFKDVYEYEFSSAQCYRVLQELRSPTSFSTDVLKEHIIEDPNTFLKTLIDSLDPVIAIDTESEGLNPFTEKLVSIQLSIDGINGYFLRWTDVDRSLFRQLFTKQKTIVMHNAVYDVKVLKINGIEEAYCTFDTLLAAHQCNENISKSLKALTWLHTTHGGYEVALDQYMKDKNISNFAEVPELILAKYGCSDACVTYKLYNYFLDRLNKELPCVKDNFYKYVMPAVAMTAEMEYQGVNLDLPYLLNYNTRLNIKLKKLKDTLVKRAQEEFDTNSTQQISRILETKFNISVPDSYRTKKGELPCDGDSLDRYFRKYGVKFARTLIKYNHVRKEVSQLGLEKYRETGVKEGFLRSVEGANLHGSYKLHGTVSGRASGGYDRSQRDAVSMSSGFGINFQNIPTTLEFRKMFLAPEGFIWARADFESAEITIQSQIAGHGPLEDAILKGMDLHCFFGCAVAKANGEDISYEEFYHKARKEKIKKYEIYRTLAKRVSFSLQYGGTKKSLSLSLGITEEQAQLYVDSYFKTYPDVKSYMDKTKEFVKRKGYVLTLLGRKRRIPQLTYIGKDSWKNRESTFKINNLFNNAINSGVQGTSGQVTIIAMTKIWKELKDRNLKSKVIINVHDELCMYVSLDELAIVKEMVERHMTEKYYENIGGNVLNLKAELEFGEIWKDEKSVQYWKENRDKFFLMTDRIDLRNKQNLTSLEAVLNEK